MISTFVLFAETWWAQPENLIAATKAALGLGFVIFVHELGHFLVAKACGVKCEKFYVGFDVPIGIGPLKLPAALFRKQWGETEYGIGIIPLGGYVKMLGQDDNPANAAKEAERIRQEEEAGEGPGLDPRSYPAKSVPQRMAIISAGVIMNLIFAVIFASGAYIFGVKYLTATVGSTVPGDPAWLANLQPGDRIVQLGREKERNEFMRFTRDLIYFFVEVGADNPCEMLIQRANGEEEWITVTPNVPQPEVRKLPTIGITSASSNRVSDYLMELDTPAQATDLAQGDTIVAVNVDGQQYDVANGIDIESVLYHHRAQTVELQVERAATEEAPASKRTVQLDPEPMQTYGIHIGMGEIVGVQADSPAQRAGIRAGDRLMQIDGQPIEDVLALDEMLLQRIGQPLTVTIQRAGASTTDEVTIAPRDVVIPSMRRRPDGPVAIDSLGVAVKLTNAVASVVPGSPAEQAGLQAGDRLQNIQFVATNEEVKELLEQYRADKQMTFDEGQHQITWAWVVDWAQNVPDGTSLKVVYERGEETKKTEFTSVTSSTQFAAERGLSLHQLNATHTASDLWDGCRLGVRETKEGIMQVFFTLRKITDLYDSLGGPGSIAMMATAEASEGWPRLLTFLTLLSANLAVLNFLPIPVLDGGHMMFLAYEGLVGKPVNERIAFGLTVLGLSFILGLMVFVIGLDVYRIGFRG